MKMENFREKKGNTTINYTNQWVFEKDFTIDGKVAKELNTTDVTIKKTIIGFIS